MKRRCWVPPVLAVVVALAAAPARTEDAGLDPARNEASVFGGISIIDARRSQRTTIPLPAIPGFPGWPGRDPGGIQVGTETKLGNSGLVGLRYAFYLRKQLALEADVAVAPSHDLRSSVDLCGSSGCYGRGDDGEAVPGMHAGEGRREGRYGFGGRSVTAWHYGAGLTYDVLGGDVRPFVIVGAGGVTYDGAPETRTDFVLRFGAGLKVYFGRLGARVDAVDHLVFDNFLTGRDEHDVHLTGGAFVRF
jgi:hypothetical protein